MAFGGWGDEALEFYEGLEADNSKTYWTRQKAVYEEQVLRPMTELLDELGPEFGESKIFRPYRDVRFSKDKTPYKTHLGAMLGGGYIQLSARGLAAGDGMYGMASDQVGRYREAVAAMRTGGAGCSATRASSPGRSGRRRPGWRPRRPRTASPVSCGRPGRWTTGWTLMWARPPWKAPPASRAGPGERPPGTPRWPRPCWPGGATPPGPQATPGASAELGEQVLVPDQDAV